MQTSSPETTLAVMSLGLYPSIVQPTVPQVPITYLTVPLKVFDYDFLSASQSLAILRT